MAGQRLLWLEEPSAKNAVLAVISKQLKKGPAGEAYTLDQLKVPQETLKKQNNQYLHQYKKMNMAFIGTAAYHQHMKKTPGNCHMTSLQEIDRLMDEKWKDINEVDEDDEKIDIDEKLSKIYK
ncbi:predicted protein [Uncinocarpus reesii 1704]|uniref:Uncharacterized protein n=1 Tax=Uncinocarpus reesii (strain UAMH 1704) TaxID=336963 RepID=C4JUD0_UNCRE|nr:uncharacterized protein UREG_06069 [Uncinocarpus reesii 1704]EEP81227.1 predicted protein [Uncinocarpus reesii 1704]